MGSKLRMCGLLTFAVLASQVANAQNPLPPDPQTSCTLTPGQFASWFANGVVTPNGIVKPADSLNFQPNSLCSFYQWSTQMFLWLNSPAYGTGGRVFDSPVFYDVEAVGGKFVLVPNTVGRIRTLGVRSAQVGSSGKQLAVSAAGVVSDVETGQAGGGGTLLSQNGSLVYYSIHVNDVFAYMATGTKSTTLPPINPPLTAFPTTSAQLKQITDFASQQLHKQVFDPTALAMELKISWVDAATVPNPQDYIKMTALVPTYNFSVPPVNGIWPTGPVQQKLLAMVGMHVVGSTAGHPEMIWATFEHVNNAPNGAYSYLNKAGTVTNVPLNPQGKWLFSNGTANPFNVENLKTVSTGLQQVNSTGATPVASNTIRTFAWGGAQGNAGVENNTEIISLNNAVISMLGNDIRKNYVHIGSVWTGGMIPPAGASGGAPPVQIPLPAQSIGSVLLSNATMETYHQVISNPPTYTPATGFNCFNCHNTGTNTASSANLSQLSHIWSTLQPLK